jgi:hypothetical protein
MIEMQHGQSRTLSKFIGEGGLARSAGAHDRNTFHQRPPYSSQANGTGLVSQKTRSNLEYGAKVEKGEM